MTFCSSAATHTGSRSRNEDSGYAGSTLLVVADGVGGAACGEVASATATVLTVSTVGAGGSDLRQLLRDAVANAHLQLRRSVERDPRRAGMATTLTAVALTRDRVMLVHLGDSRCYLLRGGELEQLTHDHTLLEALKENAGPGFSTSHSSHYSSVVLRALDHVEPPEPDLERVDLQSGDRLLLCSDGLSDVLPPAHIRSLLGRGSVGHVAEQLVRAARTAGGTDNVTAVVAELVDSAEPDDGQFVGAAAEPDNLRGCDSVPFLTTRRRLPLH